MQNLQAQNQEVFNVKYVTNQNSTQEAKKRNTLRQNKGTLMTSKNNEMNTQKE